MKTVLIQMFLFLFSSTIFAIGPYSKGESLYIWATSGLNMRVAAEAQSAKIVNISYGEKVKIIDDAIQTHPFSYTMIKGNDSNWSIDGYWVRVEYQGQMGYVFDGYLGKFPVIATNAVVAPYINLELIKEYGRENWGDLKEETKIKSLDFESNNIDPDKGHSSSYKLIFNNGSYYQDENWSFSGKTSVFIKGISLEEGYLIFNILTGFESKSKQGKGKTSAHETIEFSEIQGNKLIFRKGDMQSYSVEQVDGGVLIQSSGGC